MLERSLKKLVCMFLSNTCSLHLENLELQKQNNGILMIMNQQIRHCLCLQIISTHRGREYQPSKMLYLRATLQNNK